MSDLPEGHEIISSHSNEQDARYSAHSLLRIINRLPSGWSLYLRELPSGSFDIVKYASEG